jgi:hypothetical protein
MRNVTIGEHRRLYQNSCSSSHGTANSVAHSLSKVEHFKLAVVTRPCTWLEGLLPKCPSYAADSSIHPSQRSAVNAGRSMGALFSQSRLFDEIRMRFSQTLIGFLRHTSKSISAPTLE